MSYVSLTLADDESIITRANFNWTYNVASIFWFTIGLVPLVLFLFGQFYLDKPYQDLKIGYWISFLSAFLGSMILLAHMIELWTTEIVVTTYRFVFKTGLISRDTKEVSLNKLEEISLHQSIWGRIFGYGKLILRGTGVGVIELPNIDSPVELRQVIETAKANLRRTSTEEIREGS
ncbi:MAG: PH domain-containing protein [bacterium]